MRTTLLLVYPSKKRRQRMERKKRDGEGGNWEMGASCLF